MGRILLGSYSNSAEDEIVLRDSNLVIILAAMLCSLICLVGLFTMVRCALRCRGRRLVIQSTHHIFFPVIDRGLSKSSLEALPIVEYSPADCAGAADCAICLAEFVQGEKVRVLPNCQHFFHIICIDTWFSTRSSCPTCRRGCVDQVEEKCSTPTQSCPSSAMSAPVDQSTSLRGIACPVQYWSGNMLEPIDRYLP